jgi:hypothetical protein
MDRHFGNSYADADAFPNSHSDGHPTPKLHSDGKRIRLCSGHCHRQSDPVRDGYAFTDPNLHTHYYTCIAKPELFSQAGQSFSARDAASTS